MKWEYSKEEKREGPKVGDIVILSDDYIVNTMWTDGTNGKNNWGRSRAEYKIIHIVDNIAWLTLNAIVFPIDIRKLSIYSGEENA